MIEEHEEQLTEAFRAFTNRVTNSKTDIRD